MRACGVRGRTRRGRRSPARRRGPRRHAARPASRASACSGLATRAAMAAGMQVLAGAADRELQRAMPRLATVIEGSSGRHMAPSAESTKSAVEPVGMRRDERLEMGAAAFLLALDQELDVDRQPPSVAHEGLGDDDRDQHRPLVVGDAARIEPAVAHRRLEGRALPLAPAGRAAARRSGRRPGPSARPGAPVHSAGHDRMAAGRIDRDILQAGAAQLRRRPIRPPARCPRV